jgi:hypothetical protein
MNKYCITLFLMLLLSYARPLSVLAVAPPVLATPPSLSIAEIQITGDEFIVLQNNSGITISDTSAYWLHYFNKSDPRAPGARGSVQQLPLGVLAPGQTLLLSSIGRTTCGASITDNLSISLTDGSGFLQIMELGVDSSGSIINIPGDFVSWNSGLTGIIQKVASATGTNPQPVWYRYQNINGPNTTYPWQKAITSPSDLCQLAVPIVGLPPTIVASGSLIQSSISPPSTIVSLTLESLGYSTASQLPKSDYGLRAPILSELLPNPKEPQTDSDDEFIEIYNPNDKSFDLSAFILQVGVSTVHKFVIPKGTTIPAKSFVAYSSKSTHLTLTNNEGQAVLMDPLGKIIGKTDKYGSAKEGMSWALAEGQWHWTNKATPSSSNIIDQGSASISPISALTPISPNQKSSASNSSSGSAAGQNTIQKSSSLHPLVLAVVGTLAVAYVAYEYRHDLANQREKLRRHRASRRVARKPSEGRGASRVGIRLRRR